MKLNNTKHSNSYKKWVGLYKSGQSVYRIAKNFNCSEAVVRRGLDRMGVGVLSNFMTRTPLERYNSFVIKKEGCWGWVAALDTKGYGVFWVNGKLCLAHRFSYLIHKGDPKDKMVCHTCDNPICSNPDHLFLGTNFDNMVDCIKKGRYSNAKILPEDVKRVRAMILKGDKSVEIAKKLNVSPSLIGKIKRGERWAHLK